MSFGCHVHANIANCVPVEVTYYCSLCLLGVPYGCRGYSSRHSPAKTKAVAFGCKLSASTRRMDGHENMNMITEPEWLGEQQRCAYRRWWNLMKRVMVDKRMSRASGRWIRLNIKQTGLLVERNVKVHANKYVSALRAPSRNFKLVGVGSKYALNDGNLKILANFWQPQRAKSSGRCW